MKTLDDILNAMKELKARWVDAEVIDDAEDMWTEVPDFLIKAVPALEELLKGSELVTGEEVAFVGWLNANLNRMSDERRNRVKRLIRVVVEDA